MASKPARSRRASAFVGVMAACALAVAVPAAAQPATGSISGIVEVAGPDKQTFVVPGVTLTLTCPPSRLALRRTGPSMPADADVQSQQQAASTAVRVAVTDAGGVYRIVDVAPGVCSLVAEMEGFQSATQSVTIAPDRETAAPLRLGFDTLREDVTVTARADATDTSSAPTDRIGHETLQTAPVASERFQDALPLIPGVVRGPDGLLNINGSRSNQTGLTVNQASGTDPVTGEFALEVPVDAIQSVQVQHTAYAPEHGQSGGALAAVETQRGTDTWRVQLNNFMPRVRERGGKIVGLESFTPRLTIGGPIAKDTLTALAAVHYGLTRTRVESLPPLESDTEQEGVDVFTRLDWKASDSHHVSGTGVVSPRTQRYVGLNTFNPQPVTPSLDTDGALVSVGDRVIAGTNGLFDVRVSVKQFDVRVYPSRAGDAMVLAPDVNDGGFFNSQDRTSRRVEWLNSYTLAPERASSHLFKIGAGATFETFDGISRSLPVDIVDTQGTRLRQIAFAGDDRFGRDRVAIGAYAQDTWTLSPRVTMQYGVRADRDSATGETRAAPRASFTLLASADGRTVVRGGIGVFQSALPLNVLAFDQLQDRTIRDLTDGADRVRLIENRLATDLRMGRSLNWDVQVDREWLKNVFVRVGYRQREGRFEPILHPQSTADDDAPSAIELRTDGRSSHREGQVTGRYVFHGSDQIVASYTRALSTGDLNTFNHYFGNLYNPIVPLNERGPLPWDTPHRVLIWGSFSLPRQFLVFPVLDVRNGFPLSTIDALRDFVGPRNDAGRFPAFVSLDVQITKRIRVFGRTNTVGLKVFNITDHFNPRDYFGNVDGTRFGTFANGVGRTFRAKWVVDF